jgi:large subunit ribosomal protein L4
MTQEILTITGEPKGTIELPDALFGQKVRKDILWEAVNYYRANQRQGTASTKTRAEVSGGGKKPWRQKHTGRARHGSTRSPIWRHGGVVFGPRPRDYGLKLSAAKRELALSIALSAARIENRIRFVEDFELPAPKTRELFKILSDLGVVETGSDKDKSTLLVVSKSNDNLKRAGRNIRNLDLARAQDLNAYQVLAHRMLVFTQSATEALRD